MDEIILKTNWAVDSKSTKETLEVLANEIVETGNDILNFVHENPAEEISLEQFEKLMAMKKKLTKANTNFDNVRKDFTNNVQAKLVKPLLNASSNAEKIKKDTLDILLPYLTIIAEQNEKNTKEATFNGLSVKSKVFATGLKDKTITESIWIDLDRIKEQLELNPQEAIKDICDLLVLIDPKVLEKTDNMYIRRTTRKVWSW